MTIREGLNYSGLHFLGIEGCDCVTLLLVKEGEDAVEMACQSCHKTWYGCPVMGCKHPADFGSVDEVSRHVWERHVLDGGL